MQNTIRPEQSTTANQNSKASKLDFKAELERRFPNFTDIPEPTEEELAKEETRRQAEIRNARKAAMDSFLSDRGKRYRECRLENYQLHGDTNARARQKVALQSLTQFQENMQAAVESGNGLLLSGPVGTGKDHFLVALARTAILKHGYSLKWISGMELTGMFRDQISNDRPERDLIRTFTRVDILILSDPLPQWGDLTDYQASNLYRIVDARYNDCKPTWCSLNCTGPQEAEKRIGAATVDRLRDGAVSVVCEWRSFRQSHKPAAPLTNPHP